MAPHLLCGLPLTRWLRKLAVHKSEEPLVVDADPAVASSAYANAIYYANWRVYRGEPPSSLDFNVITHVFYAFAW